MDDDVRYLKELRIIVPVDDVRAVVAMFQEGKTMYFLYRKSRLVAKETAGKLKRLYEEGKLDRFKSCNNMIGASHSSSTPQASGDTDPGGFKARFKEIHDAYLNSLNSTFYTTNEVMKLVTRNNLIDRAVAEMEKWHGHSDLRGLTAAINEGKELDADMCYVCGYHRFMPFNRG